VLCCAFETTRAVQILLHGSLVNIERSVPPARTDAPSARFASAVWDRAFRPFFLAAAVHATFVVPWWVFVWLGVLPAPGWLLPGWWHGHEMMFGFVAAAIAGFLLTASPVWSGGPALRGRPLVALVALWIAGRAAFHTAGLLPLGWVAAVDIAFLPAVAAVVVRTLRGSGQHRNYAVVGIVVVLALANAAMHAEALGFATGIASHGLRFAIDAVVVLILVIGGRITPAFTRNALRLRGIERPVRSRPWVDGLAIASAGALAVASATSGRSVATGLLAAIAGLATAARLAGWQSWHTRSDPLLWSLHAASAWLVVGLLLVAAADLGTVVPGAAGLHALTAGGMAAAILAVMTRVGLGHTGRALVLPSGVVWCHALVYFAALARIAATFVATERQLVLLVVSALAWAAAFGWFAVRYAPILTRPRPDGRPG
jgi:uncharacterized protein involved in response to NO